MSKTKENIIIKRIALIICDLACVSAIVYIYLTEKEKVISLNYFLLLIGGLLWFILLILGIEEFLIRGKDSLLFKSFKQAFNLVFDKLLRTGLKME